MRRTIRLYSFNQRLSKSSSYRYIAYPELAREVNKLGPRFAVHFDATGLLAFFSASTGFAG